MTLVVFEESSKPSRVFENVPYETGTTLLASFIFTWVVETDFIKTMILIVIECDRNFANSSIILWPN